MLILAPTRRRGRLEARAQVRRVALSLLFISTFLICNRALEAQSSSSRVETFDLNPGGQVRIDNLRGATRIEVWDADSVRVVAEKKTPAGASLDPADLVLMGIQNTITIQCKQGGRPGRIDLTVSVPRGSRLQLLGGAWPVDVNGSLASAVIETTTGAIAYRIPANDDASVAMRSSRGLVRSTVPLAVSERAGTQSLQGRLGGGLSPIILNSQSGNITLTPGPNVNQIATAYSSPSSNADDNHPVAQAQDQRRQQGRDARPAYSEPQQGDQAERGDYDSYNPDVRPSPSGGRAPRGSGSTGSSGNNSVVFAGGDRSDDSTLSVKGGGVFERPRQERRTSGGSSGLRVRIIPSGAALGSSRDSGSSVYDQADDQDSQARDQSSSGNGSSRSRQSYDYPNAQDPRPAYGNQGRQNNSRGVSSLPDDSMGEPDESLARNNRPAAPPVLRRDSADASETARPAEARGSESANPDDEAIVLKAALVNLNVSVTNRSGQALANLKKEDFDLAENGQPQRIEFFQPQTAPFNLVLVLDLSGSIQEKLDVVKSAALRFIEVLGPEDKVAVVTFTHEIRVVSQLTSDRNELKRRIKAIDKPVGGTAFYEAMWFALADTLRATRGQRNGVVVMTDGVDSSLDRYNPAPTRVTFGQLARRLEESDVLVFPVYLDTEYEEVFERGNATSEAYSIAREQLERIADLTGGQMFKAEKVGDLSGVYKQVAAAIRTVYSVGYYPTNAEHDGTFRRVRVSVNRPDAAVRTRKGYYAK
ncbi:MAG TPA: VWA domain-containing protein [Blastocatellia bacterium]|nr:VWA domain-containing protein [Blastocatellia bacterium]